MSGRPGTDAALVARSKAGELEAFDRLVMRHRSRLYGIARQITGESDAAQDVVQDAFVNAFRSLGALRDGDRFGQWLNTIVRRQALAWVRDGDRRPETLSEAALWGVPSATRDAGPDAPTDVVERVRESLGALTQRERRAMVLHYLEGFTCEEIAAKLGVSAGGVKRILHDSRRKVRREVVEMAEAERERKGPRRLKVWIDGSVTGERGDVFDHLRPLLAQTVCLAVNKTAKTVGQIAREVGAERDYVEDAANGLAEMGVLTSPKKGEYLANFIALDAEDWRRLMRVVREPAGEAATKLAAGQTRLRSAFERTPLAASGWRWEDVIWVVYAVVVANTGTSRSLPPQCRQAWPERPRGGRYWLGGHESLPDLPTVWTTGLNSHTSPPWARGYFWTYGLERERSHLLWPGRDTAAVAEALVGAPTRRTGASGAAWR